MKQKPSDYFLGAILRGYEKEAAEHPDKAATCSGIWDQVCMECIQKSGAFAEMFAWDTRKGHHNRIGTIMETIEAGLVPSLRLDRTTHGGKPIVVRDSPQ